MDTPIFENNNVTHAENDLIDALGERYMFWKAIHDYAWLKHPGAMDE